MYIDEIILSTPIKNKSYLSCIPAVQYLMRNNLHLSNSVTFMVGENGTGKSTLIEAIAVAYGFNAEGGTKNFNFSTNASHSELYKHLKLIKNKYAKDGFFWRAESFYNLASNIDELDRYPTYSAPIISNYGGKSLHKQSHGESFLTLVQNRFSGNGLYILDEPEAALSPTKIMTLMVEIDSLVKQNSQFIIATHSPILMTYPNAEILQLSNSGICVAKYNETEHYQITKRFLENPEQMLKYLFD